MSEVVIGKDTETGQEVRIGDIERRSGLYVLGKPGMGKSALLVNILNQDIRPTLSRCSTRRNRLSLP
jgi:hypothetical protein